MRTTNLRIEQTTPSEMILLYRPIAIWTMAGLATVLGTILLFAVLLFWKMFMRAKGYNSPWFILYVILIIGGALLEHFRLAIVEGRFKTFTLDKDQGDMICKKHGLFGTKLGEKTNRIPLVKIDAVKVRMVLRRDRLLYRNLYLIYAPDRRILVSSLSGEESYTQAEQIREFLNLETPVLTPHTVDMPDRRDKIIGRLVDYFQD